ncbi:MAG: hypothetical protein CHKLHMKO_00348 [Candidatus Argoarchaeum ethanivorans]|uniref:Uncharacterized protein n=1 Tax=Candidatus Argoarchaeum ethanivorans TaxID=2608793 RepID=A0A811TE64_9EURY|nr:MAG: hypothetical protein CHKLHMKO_00348 [Candidatus Argoarchaeum ethanivorans]
MVGTVIFEGKYNTDISKFATMEEIDNFVAEKEGKMLDIVLLGDDLITSRGDIFPLLDTDIDNAFDKALKK